MNKWEYKGSYNVINEIEQLSKAVSNNSADNLDEFLSDYIDGDDEIDSNDWDSDYDTDWYEPKERTYNHDKIAEILMRELEKFGKADFVILGNDEIQHWWTKVKTKEREKLEAIKRREEVIRKIEEDARAKEALLARLTPEEKRLLGIK